MNRHVALAVVVAVAVPLGACGGSDDATSGAGDTSHRIDDVVDAAPAEPFAFVETGWFQEGTNRPQVLRTEMLLLAEDCDLAVAVPGGVQHAVVSASGDSFVRSLFADGSWASEAAWRDDVVIAAIEAGKWHAAPSAPFRAALAAQDLPDLDVTVPRRVTTAPFHRRTEWDLALTVEIDTDDIAAHQAAAAEIVETLIGVTAAPIRPDATMSWTRWWLDGTLVAEDRFTPIAGACIFQASAFAAVGLDTTDAIIAAEHIFGAEVQPYLAEAERVVGAPDGQVDEVNGFGGVGPPRQIIPLPPVGPTSQAASTSLNAAASSAGTASQTYSGARAIGLRTALGYVGQIAHAVSLINSLKTLGAALADAITGESSPDLVMNASNSDDRTAGTTEGPVRGTTQIPWVEGTPKTGTHQDDKAENADAITQSEEGRRRVIQQPELTHPDLLEEAQRREGLDTGRKPDRLVENDDGELEVWDTKHANGDTATPKSAADAAHDSLQKRQSRRVSVNLDGTKNDPADFADELRDYVDDYNANIPDDNGPYWDGMEEVVVTKNGETYPVWP